MNLTKNFTLEELTSSEYATRHGISNVPTPLVLHNLTRLAENVLQPVRDHFGPMKVNSGYRSPELNKRIGGFKFSEHVSGMAADVERPGIANLALASWIRDNLKFTQLILEGYKPGVPDSGWVHISYNPSDLKCQVLSARFINGKAVYLNGLTS